MKIKYNGWGNFVQFPAGLLNLFQINLNTCTRKSIKGKKKVR